MAWPSIGILPNQPLEAWSGRARGALGWWLGELRSAYCDATRRLAAIGRETLTIEAGEQQWILRRKAGPAGAIDRQTGDGEAARGLLRKLIGQSGRAAALVVEIPSERVLSKTIELPAAAHGDLDRILSFEISRHFPFSAERVFHRHRIVGRNGGAASSGTPTLSVEIVVVPREIVLSIAAELAAAGMRANGFALFSSPSSAPLFLPPGSVTGSGVAQPVSRRLAAGLLAMALAATVSWPLAQQCRLAAIEREIAALKPQAETRLRARDRDRRDAETSVAIARLRGGRPPLIAVLDALSREVPDGSWLTSLSVAGGEIVLEGLSPSAASIAQALGKNSDFTQIVYRSPIRRDGANGLEHFQFGITVAEKRP
jgi:general secretion pathway protein L